MIPLAITPGDPGGIGPDLCIQAAIDGELEGVVIADPEIIKRRADMLGLPVSIMVPITIILSAHKESSTLTRLLQPTQPTHQEFQIRLMLDTAFSQSNTRFTVSKNNVSVHL